MAIIDLMEESEFKHVEIVTTEGEKIKGVVEVFETAYDNDDTEASICFLTDNDEGIILYESEIEKITIVPVE